MEVAETLLDNCADPGVDLGDGCTLLHAACYYGWGGPVVDLLMRYCKRLETKIWHDIPGYRNSAFRPAELLIWLHSGYDRAHHARFRGHALAPMPISPRMVARLHCVKLTLTNTLVRADQRVCKSLQRRRRRLLTCLFDHFGPAIICPHPESTYTLMNAAIDIGSLSKVRFLVKHLGISVLGDGSAETFPLLAAVCPDEQADDESDSLLWLNRLSPSRVRYDDRAACRQRRLRIVEYLLRRGADINQQDEHGNTALCMACVAVETSRDGISSLETVDCLLRARADPSIATAAGEFPLDRAISMNNTKLGLRLLRANAVIRPHHDLVAVAARVILSAPIPDHGFSGQQIPGLQCSSTVTGQLAGLVDIFTRIVRADTQHRLQSSPRIVGLACRVAYYPFTRILLETEPPRTIASGALAGGDHNCMRHIIDAFPEQCTEHRRAILQLIPLLRTWRVDLSAGEPVRRALSSYRWTIARALLECGASTRPEYLFSISSVRFGDMIEFLIREEPQSVQTCSLINLMLAQMTPPLHAEKLTDYLYWACSQIRPDMARILIGAGTQTADVEGSGPGSSLPMAAHIAALNWRQLPQRTRELWQSRYTHLLEVSGCQQAMADWQNRLWLGLDLSSLS